MAQRGRRVEEAGEHRSGGAQESQAGHDGGAAGGNAHLDGSSVFGSGPGFEGCRPPDGAHLSGGGFAFQPANTHWLHARTREESGSPGDHLTHLHHLVIPLDR